MKNGYQLTTIRPTAELHKEFKLMAVDKDTTVSALIIDAMKSLLRKHKAEKAQQVNQ